MTFTEYLSDKFGFNIDQENEHYINMVENENYSSDQQATNKIKEMCELSGYRFDKVFSRSRNSELVLVRHVIFYLLHKNIHMSYKGLGRKFGYDHSTIIHAKDKISDLLEVGDKPCLDVYNKLKVAFTHEKVQTLQETI